MNKVFANPSKEDKIWSFMTAKFAKAQWAVASLKHLLKCNAETDKGLKIKLIEDITCVCKDGWLVIHWPLQVREMVTPLLSAPWTNTS
jgi:hypothetical protein